MSMLVNVILTVQILTALGMIGLILIQHGKGADMGAAFGSGASGSLFGSSGSANFLSRTTAILATIFFLTSLGLSYMATNRAQPSSGSVLDAAPVQTQKPAADASVPPAAPVPAESKGDAVPK